MRKIDYSDLRWNGNEYEIYAGYPLGHVSLNAEIDNLEQFREITSGISLDSLREICDAERDGRLVVLPCKAGDTVYFLIPELEMGEGGFNLSGLFISKPHRITDVGTWGFWTSGLPRDEPDGMHDFTPWGDLGKTVFLTREEAEAALRKEQSDER